MRDLTGGDGTHMVLEAVGRLPAYGQALGIVRAGGVISRVDVPQYEAAPIGFGSLFGPNITLTGGPAPVRAYIEELLPDVLDGKIEPGRVFDRTVSLDGVPEGYRAMDDRKALKVLVRPWRRDRVERRTFSAANTARGPSTFVIAHRANVLSNSRGLDTRTRHRKDRPNRSPSAISSRGEFTVISALVVPPEPARRNDEPTE